MMDGTAVMGSSERRHDALISSVLESAEVGVLVVDERGHVAYSNMRAQHLLAIDGNRVPDWVVERLPELVVGLTRSSQIIERWPHDQLTLRVRARKLDRFNDLVALEVTVAHAAGGAQVAEQLAQALSLTLSDAKLLALVWRGLSNEEISRILNVRIGTVKSRLFRLYQKLGVKKRPAAALRAAEVLAD